MKRSIVAAVAGLVPLWLHAADASACGGFFCSQQPVDQSSERILFAANPNGSTTMVVQIAYAGGAEDFSWVLPLGEVPAVDSLAVFPQAALNALDVNTGPTFAPPSDCDAFWYRAEEDGGGPPNAGGGDVTVDLEAEVGPYGVAVVESHDPAALVAWLRDNGFRVTSAMEPYIATYTDEGMKFLALKLKPGADVSQIQPFQLTLPGETPSVPLRLTALAAEPEMGILVFVLGEMRFGPANWPELAIRDDDLVWNPWDWGYTNNWQSLVARAVDEAGGQGWVTEFAGSTASYVEQIANSTPGTEEGIAAREALLALMTDRPYLSRLYTRLSPEEMGSDPIFKRVDGGDVLREHTLPRIVDGKDVCAMDYPYGETSVGPCEFAACGAGGLCRTVDAPEGGAPVAGCACVPGATARATFDVYGRTSVSCIDERMSFMNPGDSEVPGEAPLADPCLAFSCGTHGSCVPMNMTPTCECEEGFVAVAALAADGARSTSCVAPSEPVPSGFYGRRLADPVLPGGRIVITPPAPEPEEDTGCEVGVGHRASDLAGVVLLALLGLARSRRSARAPRFPR